jgi:hypothetical protein
MKANKKKKRKESESKEEIEEEKKNVKTKKRKTLESSDDENLENIRKKNSIHEDTSTAVRRSARIRERETTPHSLTPKKFTFQDPEPKSRKKS